MKKSAITRIVIYSVLILLLAGLLVSLLAIHQNGGVFRLIRVLDDAEEVFDGEHDDLDIDEILDFDDDDDDDADNENRRNDQDYLTTKSGEKISVEDENISQIIVDWISGNVTVEPGDVDTIEIEESAGKNPMVYAVKGRKLEIKFSSKMNKASFGMSGLPSKDLLITVPRDWNGGELTVHSVSADVEIRDLELSEVEYQGVSGNCLVENARLGELSMQTVSGDVTVVGEIRELECESVSADCDLTVTNVPSEISMEGVSGNLKLTLPEGAGFTVEIDGINKDLDTDFEVTGKNGKYVSGDGSCEIEIEGVSGKAKIRKAA